MGYGYSASGFRITGAEGNSRMVPTVEALIEQFQIDPRAALGLKTGLAATGFRTRFRETIRTQRRHFGQVTTRAS
jgi:hypothetical protein